MNIIAVIKFRLWFSFRDWDIFLQGFSFRLNL